MSKVIEALGRLEIIKRDYLHVVEIEGKMYLRIQRAAISGSWQALRGVDGGAEVV